jgi:hypothetical protein
LQLDKTRIVIRERTYLEILDLALRVIRAYPAQLFIVCTLGSLPWIVLNWWLIGDWAHIDPEFAYADNTPWAFLWWTLILVVWEMPLAAVLTTLFLGQATFLQRPSVPQIRTDLIRSIGQLLVFQIILRAILVIMFITWILLFCIWPYLNEVVLLERNPLRSKSGNRMTTLRRVGALHGSRMGELFGRWLASILFGVALTIAFWSSIVVVAHLVQLGWGVATGEGRPWVDGAFFSVFFPAAVWLVVNFFAVVRFLCYLDLRIRSEGWEVELILRAQAARFARQPA